MELDTYLRETLDAVRAVLAPWLPPLRPGQHHGPDAIVRALRAAENDSSGPARELWGRAAVTADAASWIIDPEGDTGRELWGIVREHATTAAAEMNTGAE